MEYAYSNDAIVEICCPPQGVINGAYEKIRYGYVAGVFYGYNALNGEFATLVTSRAGECHGYGESRRLLSRTSMAYLKRQATEAKSRGAKEWIDVRTKLTFPHENQGSARN